MIRRIGLFLEMNLKIFFYVLVVMETERLVSTQVVHFMFFFFRIKDNLLKDPRIRVYPLVS